MMSLSEEEAEAAAARAAVYPKNNGWTFIAGYRIKSARDAARMIRERPELLEAG